MAANLLDIAKAEAGGLELEAAALDPCALARGVAEAFSTVARSRGQAIDLDLPGEPVEIEADRELVRRVLQNLLDNALRYSPARSRVRVSLREAPEASVELAVDDDGPGIPPELHAKVFEKYVRLEGTGGEDMGRGLGLSFCRLAALAHGGRIWADASPLGRKLLPSSPSSTVACAVERSQYGDCEPRGPRTVVVARPIPGTRNAVTRVIPMEGDARWPFVPEI